MKTLILWTPSWVFLQGSDAARSELPGGYGAALIQGLVSLGAVCLLAWLLLRFGARRGFGTGQGKHIRVVERHHLDTRQNLYLVEVAGKLLLLGGASDQSPTLIAELDPEDLPELPEAPKATFKDVLARLRGEAPPGPSEPEDADT